MRKPRGPTVLVVVLVCTSSFTLAENVDPDDDGTRKIRTWTDASGSNTIEALYIEFALGKVRLRTRDGKFLSLKLNQLSAEDRQYVMKQVQQR